MTIQQKHKEMMEKLIENIDYRYNVYTGRYICEEDVNEGDGDLKKMLTHDITTQNTALLESVVEMIREDINKADSQNEWNTLNVLQDITSKLKENIKKLSTDTN